jgi:hypothetical protein
MTQCRPLSDLHLFLIIVAETTVFFICTIKPHNLDSHTMTEHPHQPDPAKVAFLRSLPTEIKASITGEEAEQFMYGAEIPESLYHKIKDFLV